ncbi:DUF559 domain-containing protein [Candidatus Gracilibacteria bacterium]|nr:DUF559 domain-containing protein [Candidatus Gracilibacteria bacterium]
MSYTYYRSDLKKKARENRHYMSAPEKKMWEILSQKNMGYRFLRQKPIHNFIVDFYCASLKLIIEVDGNSHGEQGKYDRERTLFLNGLGFEVVRYWNNDVMMKLEGVYDDLFTKIEQRKKKLFNIQKPPPTPPL